MALETADGYLDSVKALGLGAHILGKKTGDLHEHGLVKPSFPYLEGRLTLRRMNARSI